MENSRESFTQNNFDLVRLFAATQVLMGHGAPYVLRCHLQKVAVVFGDSLIAPFYYLYDFPGVPIFFVVSGFLISASYERSQSLKTYFTNRVLRIFPALWVCLAISVGIIFFFHVPFQWSEFLPWVAAHATVVQSYNPSFLRNFGIGTYAPGAGVLNGSLWTIPIELQFYCIFPILYFVLNFSVKKFFKRKIGNVEVLFSFLVFLGISFYLDNYFLRPGDTTRATLFRYLNITTFLPWFYLFLFGWVLQKNFERIGAWFRGRALFWIAGYVLCLIAIESRGIQFQGLEQLKMLALGCVAISCAYTLPGLASRITRGNDISYGVYIYHMLIGSVFIQIGFYGWPRWECLLCLLVVTYLLAFLSWRWVEKPILALKKTSIHKIRV